MKRTSQLAALGAAALVAAACADLGTSPTTSPLASDIARAAFSTVPLGYSDLTTSYAGDGALGPAVWLPGAGSVAFNLGAGGQGGGPGGGHGHGGPGGGDLMGGGMHDAFVGGIGGGGRRGHHGPFGGALGGFGGGALRCDGAFDAAAGRFVCSPVTRNGVTTNRSARYTTTDGTVQQAFDTLTTNTVNVRTSTSGTVEYARDGESGGGHRGHHHHAGRITGDTTTILTATTQVSHESDRTVAGLAQGSAQRTVNGSSTGTESTAGTSSRGSFTATRTATDVTEGVVVPLQDGRPTYPTAGTVTRTMSATVTFEGQAAATSTRKEVVTYDGSATAKVTITQDGVTRSCTLPLPRGRLTCSE